MKLNVSRVQLSCLVKGCTNCEAGMFLDRHHRRSQKMFVHAFERRNSRRYRAFKERYYQFHEDDISRICRAHHEHVHEIYYTIVRQHKLKLGLPLHLFSWAQAEILMRDLERAFYQYVKDEEKRLAQPGAKQLQIPDFRRIRELPRKAV